MENKIGMVGKGRVVNGRIVFTEVLTGKGFSANVSKPVVRHEPAIKNEVIVAKEVIDVPNFIKNRKRTVVETVVVEEPVDKVVSINNGYQGEAKQTVRSVLKKLNNWLWDLED